MGWWRLQDGGVIGDGPADILDALERPVETPSAIPPKALREIRACYLQDFGREPTESELEALVEFCR